MSIETEKGRGKMVITNELRKLRKYHEITQEEMAELLGISVRTYIEKEKGNSQFKANEMYIISRKFGKTIDEIFFPQNLMEHEEV